tara:strand:+ start:1408 stop:2598 length:1191 start_codon:yes stop_codon:yes gene_type:complete
MNYFGLYIVWLILLTFVTSANSEEVYWTLTNDVSSSFESNYSLVRDENKVEKLSNRLTAILGIDSTKTENLFTLQHRYSHLSDPSISNGNSNFYVDYNLSHELSKRSNVNAQFSYSLQEANADEYSEFGSFFILEERNKVKQRNLFNSKISWTYFISPYWQNDIALTALNVSYEDGENTSLIDYENYGFNLNLYHFLSQKIDLFWSLSASNFKPNPSNNLIQESNSIESNTVNLMMGSRYKLNEVTELSFSLGERFTDYSYSFAGEKSSNSGWLLTTSAKKQFERSSLDINFSRSLEPSFSGNTVLRDRIEGAYTFYFQENKRLKISYLSDKEKQEINKLNQEEKRQTFNLIYSYKFKKQHKFYISLRHRIQSKETSNNSNGIHIGWLWSTQKIHL